MLSKISVDNLSKIGYIPGIESEVIKNYE